MTSYGNHGGRDGGTGRITGGHDGRPDDTGMKGGKAVVPLANETCMVGLRIEPVVHSTI